MNQTIEAVKARDRVDPFAFLFAGDLDVSRRQTVQIAPLWFREELGEAVRREAEMHVPTPDELDRMAAEWALAGAPVYGRAGAAAAAAATSTM